MKNLFHLCLLAILFAVPALSNAACTVLTPTGAPTPLVIWMDGSTSWPRPLRFDPTVPDGTVLFRLPTSEGAAGFSFTCPNGIGNVIQKPSASLSSLGNNIYNTNVPGVGYRLTFTPSSTMFPGQVIPVTDTRWASQTSTGTITLDPRIYALTVELIKTGPITAGGTLAGETVGWYAENGASEVLSVIWPGGITIAPQVPTCSVTSRSISVPLGNVPVSRFTTVGSTSPSTEPFNITLQCSGGAAGAVTNVYTTLTDQTNPANISDTLTLTPTSTAAGVGIQVLNGTTVISYGPDSNVAGNINQWHAGMAGNGTFNIPLTARYIKTSQTIVPGSANGRATFTMSYQ